MMKIENLIGVPATKLRPVNGAPLSEAELQPDFIGRGSVARAVRALARKQGAVPGLCSQSSSFVDPMAGRAVALPG